MITNEEALTYKKEFESFVKSYLKSTQVEYNTYMKKRLPLINADISDIVSGNLSLIRYVGSKNKSYVNLHLDEEGRIPKDRVIYYNALIAYGYDRGIDISYDVLYDGEEAVVELKANQ